MTKLDNILENIKSKSSVCGIASEQINFAKQLVDNKLKNTNLFVCEGLWAVDKLIDNKIIVTHFFYNQDTLDNLTTENLIKLEKMVKYSKQSFAISTKACKKISDRDGYDEYFIIAEQPLYTFADFEKMFVSGNEMAIVMDGLEQPGNIGAILRSFDCAGGKFAIITNKKASLTNSRLVRASLGASFLIPTIEADIDTVQRWLVSNNYRCIVTDLQTKKTFKDADYSGNIAIVAGNEHTGISPSWRSVKNAESVIIPMLGSCESLNVGFASTLVSYEAGLKKYNVKLN